MSATGEVGTVTFELSASGMIASLGEVTVLVPTSITVTDFRDES